MGTQYVNLSHTFDEWRQKFNSVATWQGDLDVLETSVTSDLVLAVNSLVTHINTLDVKASGRIATTSTLNATYDASALTLTNSGTKAVLEIDDITLVADNRVLIKDQTSGTQNGIYTVTNIGSTTTNWILTRATDFNSNTNITAGAFMFITEGTTNADAGFLLTTDDDITLDTTSLTFASFTSAGISVSDTSGLNSTGSNLSINVDDVTIEIASNALQVKNNGIDKTKINDDVAGTGLIRDDDGSLKSSIGNGLSFDADNKITLDPNALDGNGLWTFDGHLHVLIDNKTLAYTDGTGTVSFPNHNRPYDDIMIMIADGGVKSIKLDDNIDIVEDFTVGGDLLYIDNSENKIGINTSSPREAPGSAGSILDIRGAVDIRAGTDAGKEHGVEPLFSIRGKADDYLLYVDSTRGSVCIGTDSEGGSSDPNAGERLTVNGAISIRKTKVTDAPPAADFGKLIHEEDENEDEGDLIWRYRSNIQGGKPINISRAVPRAFLNVSWRETETNNPMMTILSTHGISTIEELAPEPWEDGAMKVTFSTPFADVNYLVWGVAHPDDWSVNPPGPRYAGGGLIVQAPKDKKTVSSCELHSIGHGENGLAGGGQRGWYMDNIYVVFYGEY